MFFGKRETEQNDVRLTLRLYPKGSDVGCNPIQSRTPETNSSPVPLRTSHVICPVPPSTLDLSPTIVREGAVGVQQSFTPLDSRCLVCYYVTLHRKYLWVPSPGPSRLLSPLLLPPSPTPPTPSGPTQVVTVITSSSSMTATARSPRTPNT